MVKKILADNGLTKTCQGAVKIEEEQIQLKVLKVCETQCQKTEELVQRALDNMCPKSQDYKGRISIDKRYQIL